MYIQLYKHYAFDWDLRFMKTQVLTKWGNSLGLRIPASMAKQAGLAAGTNVTVTFMDGALIIKPERKKKYTLDELLEGMTPEQVHAEVGMGGPVGHEVW
jgi:antitoxin MazE